MAAPGEQVASPAMVLMVVVAMPPSSTAGAVAMAVTLEPVVLVAWQQLVVSPVQQALLQPLVAMVVTAAPATALKQRADPAAAVVPAVTVDPLATAAMAVLVVTVLLIHPLQQ
jgi:hypothetical protein